MMSSRIVLVAVVASGLVTCLLSACGPLEPGVLPTEEERCAIQRGIFLGGICHTSGGQ
jgi:hypothetical protein